MKKVRVGVVGYGNLGKSIEELVSGDDRLELVCVFSRRIVKSQLSKVDFTGNIHKYKGMIDILFLCGGSSSSLMSDAQDMLSDFCTIDAFDIHKKIGEHVLICDAIARQNRTVAFCSIGWDPGLFSIMRVLFNAIYDNAFTTWGRGVSQGHSEALRCIKNVKQAIEYTMPNGGLVKKIKSGKIDKLDNEKALHRRECYIVAERENQKAITEKILNMPQYFKGYSTSVKYIDEVKMLKHNEHYHSGEVFVKGNEVNFKLKTQSNPTTTAKIMIAYAKVLYNYYKEGKYGAYNILQIPICDLLKNASKYV